MTSQMSPASARSTRDRYVPGWEVSTVEKVTTSTCTTCRWPHRSRDVNLACIARVDHELTHRRNEAAGRLAA